MKKKSILVGLLAGGAALTGLAGSAYADGGTAPGTGKAHGPDGKPIAVRCTGKGVPGKGVPGKGGDPAFKVKVKPGTERTGAKPPVLPPPGRTVLRTGDGGKALPAPPSGATALRSGQIKLFKDGKRTFKPPMGVRRSVSHPGDPGVPPSPGGEPPVSTSPVPSS